MYQSQKVVHFLTYLVTQTVILIFLIHTFQEFLLFHLLIKLNLKRPILILKDDLNFTFYSNNAKDIQ